MKVDLKTALDKASKSKWALWKLNFFLGYGIPFNRPHRIRVVSVDEDAITTSIPYRRKNQNHIRGIHACGLATAAEFCSGLVLLRNLDPRKFRLIMQKIEVDYHYQAKFDALATFGLPGDTVEAEIKLKLEKDGVVFYTCEIPVKDVKGNLLCTAYTRWQIKPWDKVRTKS